MIKTSLDKAEDDDLIIINDVDEIPNLNGINFNNIKKKLIIFKQKIFYYKFNLMYESKIWHGSKACKKKYFKSPQWLRNTKHKKISFLEIRYIIFRKKTR